MPGKKDSVGLGNGILKQKNLILRNLQELHCAFKERHPNVKVGFSIFFCLHKKWCVFAGSSGTYSVCICTTHQNAFPVHALNWDITYKDLISKVV